MAHQVKVYSTPTCAWCKRTKQFLDDNKIAYQSIDVAADKVARDEMIAKTGQIGVPVIEVDGEIVVNCDNETNVPGLFAAGDVTTVPEKQIVIAAGEGAKAALRTNHYLQRRK